MNKQLKGHRVVCFFLLIVFLLPSSVFSAQESIGIEELAKMYGEETVVTTSKREQKILESPVAISVVTAEDIKQSGATKLSEALLMVPGIEVGVVLSSYSLVGGIRGFFKTPVNTIIFLIDGVPWMHEVYGISAFDTLPIALDEIERIEVLRGPGSSLYGANAMFGVINVITKKLKDTQKSLVSLKAGERGTYIADYVYGGALKDKLFYRLSAGFYRTDQWDYVAFSEDPASKYGRLNLNADYLIDDNSKINAVGSYIDGRELYWSARTTGPIDYNHFPIYQATLTYTSKSPNILLRTYYHFLDAWKSGWAKGSRSLYFKEGSKAIEFQHTLTPFNKDTLVWGANFTQLWAKGPLVTGSRRHDTNGVFFDNNYKFSEKFQFDACLRRDGHPNTGWTVSPRLSLLYFPKDEQALHLTWSSSYRNPDFIETYYYSSLGPVSGHEENKAEKAETYELGYRGKITEKLSAEQNAFYTKVKDYIWFVRTGATRYDYINIEPLSQYGFETELKYTFTNWLSGVLNHTIFQQWQKNETFYTLNDQTPAHLFNAQLRAIFKNGFSANLSAHYRSHTIVPTATYSTDPRGVTVYGGKAKDYMIVNLRLGYKFKLGNNDAEIGMSAYNLLDNNFDDIPFSTQDVHRRVVTTFTYEF